MSATRFQMPMSNNRTRGYIYKITSPIGRTYIGKTANPEKRKKFYRLLHCKRQTKLYRSLCKYGWEQHTFEIIDDILYDEQRLNELEIKYIAEYGTFNTVMGLNLTSGGKFGKLSESSRLLLTARLIGKKLSDETKQKLRLINLGKKQSEETIKKKNEANRGKKRSDATRQKISMAKKGMKPSEAQLAALKVARSKKLPLSEASKEKSRQSHLIKIKNGTHHIFGVRYIGKKVIDICTLQEFESLKVACEHFGYSYSAVKQQLSGVNPHKTNLRWAA